jgi:hypothetical protein
MSDSNTMDSMPHVMLSPKATNRVAPTTGGRFGMMAVGTAGGSCDTLAMLKLPVVGVGAVGEVEHAPANTRTATKLAAATERSILLL